MARDRHHVVDGTWSESLISDRTKKSSKQAWLSHYAWIRSKIHKFRLMQIVLEKKKTASHNSILMYYIYHIIYICISYNIYMWVFYPRPRNAWAQHDHFHPRRQHPLQRRVLLYSHHLYGAAGWGAFGSEGFTMDGAAGSFHQTFTLIHWIGLRENLQETMVFTIKYRAFL